MKKIILSALVIVALFKAESSLAQYKINTLSAGQNLRTNNGMRSENGLFNVLLQSDGNLCVYKNGDAFIWCSMTNAKGGNNLEMQTDGNLVLYGANHSPIWSTDTYRGTADKKGSRLVIENDGSLILYNANNKPVWKAKDGRLY
ncbi:MAG: hypothetical protein RIQ33_198 [Bacteroidota bacterium]|jgi:hypothetical protein